MKNVLKSKFLWAAALTISLGIAGCNIFNPTESVNIMNDDPDALTYEGYLKFRNNEYTEAVYYFQKAIEADESHSEAWLGLIKAKMNEEKLNAFNLLKYANAKRNGALPLVDMPEDEAAELKRAIDTVFYYANTFKTMDEQNRLDGVITMKTKSVSDGYIVLQLLNAMLVMRKTSARMQGCQGSPEYIKENCDIGSIINGAKNDPKELVEAFNGIFETCEENPESMSEWAGLITDEWGKVNNVVTGNAQADAFRYMYQALAEETKDTDDPAQLAKTMNILASQMSFSDLLDDDGDGCIDEEIYDGEDNDGDGEVDEDLRDKTNSINYDDARIAQNVLNKKNSIKDLRVVSDARPNGKYVDLDIDMDGKTYDEEDYTVEWDFIYTKYDDRVKHNDHKFKFAKNMVFNPKGYDPDTFIGLKRAIAQDINKDDPTFDLKYRQENIGGCWVNYSEKDFKKWFEGRN